jgi:hypothetical protein
MNPITIHVRRPVTADRSLVTDERYHDTSESLPRKAGDLELSDQGLESGEPDQ